MTDIVDSATRSRMMSGIRGKNTKPELVIRSLLHRKGFRFRLHQSDLPGKPDVVLPKYRAVVFVHGCFWHGHGCKYFKWPSSREEFWRTKICRNQMNDREALLALKNAGWRVAVVWECAVKGISCDALADTLEAWLLSERSDTLVISGNQT